MATIIRGSDNFDTSAAGKVLQVVSTSKTTTWSSSLNAGQQTGITGLSASITPSSTSSKIMIWVSLNMARGGNYPIGAFSISRDGNLIATGPADSSRSRVTSASLIVQADANSTVSLSGNYLDSPSSTSAVTYQVNAVNTSGASRTLYVNSGAAHSTDAGGTRPIATITLMEIAG